MPDYSKSKIYSIRFLNDDNHIYIGSTTQPLSVRFGGHKIMISTLYKYIQDIYNGDWSKCYIELYEEFKCENKEQLNKREGEVIRDFMKNNEFEVLNKRIEGRTFKEYLIENKEKLEEYRQNNKEKIKKYRKNTYEKNKEKYKEYYEKNKEKNKEYNKEYRQNNKEKLKSYKRDRQKETERKQEYRQRIRIFNFLEFIKDL